jgi:peptidoglycan/xylan/chitin deacetylase (PgdA/CDA1 family)
LDALRGKACATFFCIGRKLEGNEELIRRIDYEGHLVGMHSYSHSNWFDFFSPGMMKTEFSKTEERIREILGKSWGNGLCCSGLHMA